MQGIPLHVPACQRLIVHEDHGVVLGVRLVGPRVHPARLLARLRAKPSNVVPTVHLYQQYRTRQCFGYDTVSGYDFGSPDPGRPKWKKKKGRNS
jgi:hypothetical protein